MGDSEEKLPFDDAFDDAFDHLSECRRAYEDDPRDPQKFAALGAARAALEDARKVMEAERIRLGLEPRKVQLPDGPHVDSDGRAEWQGILGD